MRFNSKATPTHDTDYGCHINTVELVNQSYGVHITPHVINSLGGGHTQTHTHTDSRTKAILRNQARAWFKNYLGTLGLLLNHQTVAS